MYLMISLYISNLKQESHQNFFTFNNTFTYKFLLSIIENNQVVYQILSLQFI